MPKQAFSIGKFKGLQSEYDPRDIEPGALVKADDIFIDKPGKIRLARVSDTYSAGDVVAIDTGTNCYRGYGLFQFSSDYEMTTPQDAVNTDYLLVQKGASFTIAENYNSSDFDITSDLFTEDEDSESYSLGTQNANVKPCYYYVDGALRICDGNFDNVAYNAPKWLGYIDRTHFEELSPTTNCTYKGWYIQNQAITAPTAGTLTVNTGSPTAPSAGTGFGLFITQSNLNGNIPDDREYEFAQSFIYDGVQESKLTTYSQTLTLDSGNNNMRLWVAVTNPFNPRISGGNIYIREANTDSEWLLFAKIDLSTGVSTYNNSDSESWEIDSGDTIYTGGAGDSIRFSELSSITYEMNSGISPDEDNIFATYKTVCIANRKAYIGNVQIGEITYGDKMLKSPVNKFDIFPESNNIDVAINDGDEIVKLVALSDRILQFKRRNLYVINIADDYEYLEATYELKGTEEPYRVCKFNNVVAWCNKFGVYIYSDGELQEISKVIKDDWQDFFGADSNTSNVSIGYDELQKKLVIVNSVGYKTGDPTENTGNTYVYDVTNGQWTKAISMFDTLISGEDYTNFVTDVDGKLLVFKEDATPGDSEVKCIITTDKQSSSVDIITGDMPIDDIANKKRFYGVKITYRVTGGTEESANIKLKYGIDGISPDTSFEEDSSLKCTNNLWSTIERTVSTPIDFYSIAIEIYSDGTCAAGFEINDISIIYRPIGIR